MKRYDLEFTNEFSEHRDLVEHPNGDLVYYEDVEALRAVLIEALETAVNLLQGSGICSALECGGHCGLSHWRGCDAVKEYFKDLGPDLKAVRAALEKVGES